MRHSNPVVADHYFLEEPLTPGRHRLEIIDHYRLGDGHGQGTLTSHIDTLTNASAPTLTSLRIVDAGGRSVTNVPAFQDAALQFSARQSTYFPGSVVLHSEIDAAATRVWWRSHGTSGPGSDRPEIRAEEPGRRDDRVGHGTGVLRGRRGPPARRPLAVKTP